MKIFSRFKNRLHPGTKVGLGTEVKRDYRSLLSRIILALAVIATVAAMYLSLVSKSAGWIVYSIPELREGDISPRREVAPFDLDVPKPPRILEQERDSAENSALPVFTLDRTTDTAVTAEIDSLFSLCRGLIIQTNTESSDSLTGLVMARIFGRLDYAFVDSLAAIMQNKPVSFTRKLKVTLIDAFDDIFSQLIVSSLNDMYMYTDELFILEDGEETQRVEVVETMGVDEAGELLGQNIAEKIGENLDMKELQTIQTIAKRLVRPNLWYNREMSLEISQEARDAVPVNWTAYKKNERIIDANVQVTAMHMKALETLRSEISRRSFIENPLKHYLIALGKIVIAFGIIGIFLGYLYLYHRIIFTSFSKLLLLTIITLLPLTATFYAAWSGGLSVYLIPVAIASILTTILFDAGLGIMISMVISFLAVSMIPDSGLRMGMIYFIVGGVGALTVGRVRHRKEFYRSMFFLPLTMAVVVASTNDWLTHPALRDVGYEMFLGAMNGFFCPIIAIGLLPLLESVFKVTTDITLLELSDLNNPLLKEIAVKAPGTFSSVLVVGSLAEAAAEKIGASALLSRVGSYYHDIGKMVIPEYFIENQMGEENPHDRLSPHMSALVISSHVKEGYELGTKYGLPEAILDIIQQHHGTSLMAAIYHKAEEESNGEEVDEAAFRYPGPKPQTREAAIVMLADLVEAASRSVQERSPGRLITLINKIIHKRYMDGELDECDLTLKDLHDIEESFLPVLVGSQHGRIEYPWQTEQKENNKKPEIHGKGFEEAVQD